MQLIDIRIVQDTNGVPYQVADVLEDGAVLPHSVNLHAFIGELLEQNHNLKAEVANLNAGAKLMHSLATGGESRLDADLAAKLQWEDEKPITGINWQNYPDFEDEPKEAQPKIDFNSVPEIKI